MSMAQTSALARKRRILLLCALVLCSAMVLGAQEKEAGERSEPAIGWKWANFALLAAGLGYLIAKNAPAVFRARTVEIQKGIAEAQALKNDAERRAAEVEARMRTLGAEIERLRAESSSEMQKEAGRIREETVKQVARIEQQAAQEIEAAAKTARRDLKNYAAMLALDLAEQRVREKVDASTEASLVDGFLQDLQRQEVRRQESRY
jgi:F-type H+-transporting ATPase subunit b